MATGTKKALAKPPAPQLHWTEHLLDWKIGALLRLRAQLEHLCSGPKSHIKSYALLDAVQHVVAQDVDPDSGLGLHLQHMLTGAVAQEIINRDDLMPYFQKHFPGAQGVPAAPGSPGRAGFARAGVEAFIRKYVNSRWWCQSLCELENACCADVVQAVEAAIRSAEKERAL